MVKKVNSTKDSTVKGRKLPFDPCFPAPGHLVHHQRHALSDFLGGFPVMVNTCISTFVNSSFSFALVQVIM